MPFAKPTEKKSSYEGPDKKRKKRIGNKVGGKEEKGNMTMSTPAQAMTECPMKKTVSTMLVVVLKMLNV